jgi:TonB family protein
MPNKEVLVGEFERPQLASPTYTASLQDHPMSKYFLTVISFLGVVLMPGSALAQDSKGQESETTYFDFQVEKAVRVRAQVAPEYPELLRMAHVEGSVLVQFIVDEAGVPQMKTFKVLRSADAAFSESVRRAVSNSSFYPAEIKGKKVKQLVQQPFQFANSK